MPGSIHLGGVLANSAVGVSRLGRRTGFIGVIGNDLFGRILVETLRLNIVDTELVKVKGVGLCLH